MKKLFVFFSLFAFSQFVQAQNKDTLHIHLFPDGKISSIITMENFWGKAFAYNKTGVKIYEREVRRVAGSAMVHFTHYPSGGVMKANYSSHPDAGIQWYKSTTIFDENGKITEEFEDSNEKLFSPTIIHHRPTVSTPPPAKDTVKLAPQNPEPEIGPPHEPILNPQKPKKEIVVCASIHNNTTWMINHSSEEIEVHFKTLRESHTYRLKPGEQREGPTYISAEIASPPQQSFPYTYKLLNKKSKVKLKVVTETLNIEAYKTKHQLHFFESNVH